MLKRFQISNGMQTNEIKVIIKERLTLKVNQSLLLRYCCISLPFSQ